MIERLASFLRPKKIEDFVGQSHLLNQDGILYKAINQGNIFPMIFWGPAGTGKTTLAYIISQKISADFFHFSGATSKKSDLNKVILKAKVNYQNNKNSILFLDEIHRWTKTQQDALLPFVEKGIITLIGATTENPGFSIINALLSRCKVFIFKKHTIEDIYQFLLKNKSKIESYKNNIKISDEVLDIISKVSHGDMRDAINTLELLIHTTKAGGKIIKKDVLKIIGQKEMVYNKTDDYYNIISAIHKSLRDSDADASCYWIMRLLASGEDPLVICRRLIRFASEDIGIADNFALQFANDVYDSIYKVGMPEANIILLQLAVYLAGAPKNNLIYVASKKIQEDIQKYGDLPVPLHLRNSPTKFQKGLGYGQGYKYAHDYKDAKIDQEHMPEKLKNKKYF